MLKVFNRVGWAISAGVALALSAYSLFYVGRAWGMPPILAGMVSVVLDGAAIVSAEMALKANAKNGRGGIDQALTFVFAGLSAWLNSYHARLVHAGGAAWALYALPPIVAVVLFERHIRGTRRATGKRVQLPVIQGWAWVLSPVQSFRVFRGMVLASIPNAEETDLSESDKIALVRAWAQMNGVKLAGKGKIPASVWAAYRKGQDNGKA